MIIEHLGKKFYISKRLYNDLLIYINHIVNKNEDMVILIDGNEGSGKSVFSRQIGWTISYILETIHSITIKPNINNLHFTLEKYIKSSLDGGKYQINILDESRRILNRRVVTRESRAFTDYLSECRKYNQIHIILLPAYHDIDKYIILWRCKMLLHCIKYIDKDGNLIRGQFKNYPINDSLVYLWEQGRYKYPKFSPLKFGGYQDRFPNYECFDDIDKYVKKQIDEGRVKYLENPKPNKFEIKYLELINKLKLDVGAVKTSQYINTTPREIYHKIKKLRSITI